MDIILEPTRDIYNKNSHDTFFIFSFSSGSE